MKRWRIPKMDIPHFEGKEIVIATMHGKERVIAPLLEEGLKIKAFVAGINTDELGTFSGEIERKLSPLDAAREKCRLAMEFTGKEIAIASEGSFGSHPYIPFAQGNEEIVLLVDKRSNTEFVGRELTAQTNMSGEQVSGYKEALQFARSSGFPRHGLIIRKSENSSEIFRKGLNDVSLLKRTLNNLLEEHPSLWLETDMRAMYNPTRMRAIEKATQNLIQKIKSKCPVCSFPGYWISEAIPGLPCSNCGLPTRSTLGHNYKCKKCDHGAIKYFPNSKKEEDPMYCDHCNP